MQPRSTAFWKRIQISRTPGRRVSACGLAEGFREGPFFQQQPSKRTQIIEDAAAAGHVSFELVQFKSNELESFLAATGTIGASQGNVCFYVRKGILDGLREQRHIFV